MGEHKIVEARKLVVQDMLRSGKSPKVIMRKLNLSFDQVWRYGGEVEIKVLTKHGIKRARKVNKMIRLSMSGYSPKEIAKKVHLTRERVRQVLVENNAVRSRDIKMERFKKIKDEVLEAVSKMIDGSDLEPVFNLYGGRIKVRQMLNHYFSIKLGSVMLLRYDVLVYKSFLSGSSVEDISQFYGRSRCWATNSLKRTIGLRAAAKRGNKIREKRNNMIIKEVTEEGKSVPFVADKYGLALTAIYYILRKTRRKDGKKRKNYN